jgi:hypothetical protein
MGSYWSGGVNVHAPPGAQLAPVVHAADPVLDHPPVVQHERGGGKLRVDGFQSVAPYKLTHV